MREEIGELRETALLTVGLATAANHKPDKHAERIGEHEKRLAAFERERPQPPA